MKLIMENFRKFVLKERKSDEAYIKAAKFFLSILSLENFDVIENAVTVPVEEAFDLQKHVAQWKKRKEENPLKTAAEGVFAKAAIKNPENKEHDRYFFKVKEEKLEDLWEQYLKTVGGKDDIIFTSYEKWKYWLKKFSLVALYKAKGNVGGHMEEGARMTVYLKDKIDGSTPEGILMTIAETKSKLFIHESAHWFNEIRASGEMNRETGAKKVQSKDKSVSDPAYHNSTEELQARLTDAFSSFNQTSWDEASKEEVFVKLSSKDVQGAIIEFLDTFYTQARMTDWTDHSEDYKSRLFGRAYQFLKKAMKSEDFKKWANQAEEKGTIIPRSGAS